METTVCRRTQHTQPIALFSDDVRARVLLSVHLLGKPTAAQLYRLHADMVSNIEAMRSILASLSRGPNAMLNMIKPVDVNNLFRVLPYVYLDTTKSRRFLEQHRGIVFKRPPPKPGRNWDFLYHDVTMCDDLVPMELTARKFGDPFWYQSFWREDGKPFIPRVSISHGGQTKTLRPEPDAMPVYGDCLIKLEHDCGKETIKVSDITAGNTLGRKELVYEQLERDGFWDKTGYQKRIRLYVIEGKRRTKKSSRARVRGCVRNYPDRLDPKQTFYTDRYTYLEAGDDLSKLECIRADGQAMTFRQAVKSI